jgi:hypothetical protein
MPALPFATNLQQNLFFCVFPDSQIAKEFTCGENKCPYLCRFGLALYFHEKLLNEIKAANEFVILFDESMNFSCQQKQMDVHVRLWDMTSGVIRTHYLGSEFMGHGTAD